MDLCLSVALHSSMRDKWQDGELAKGDSCVYKAVVFSKTRH